MAFSDSHFWCPPPLCETPSHRVSGLVSTSNKHSRTDGVWLARLAHKRHYRFCLDLFWITQSESWLPCGEDPLSPCVEVCIRRNRGLQPQPASTKLPALKMTLHRQGPLSRVKPSDARSLSWYHDRSLPGDPGPKPPKFLTHKHCMRQ